MTGITPMETAGTKAEGLSAWTYETRALLKLAGPLVVTQLAQMAIMTTDVVMLGRFDTQALAGSALGYTVYYFTWLIGMGPTAAISPMVAHILGARPNDRLEVRAVMRMGFWVVLLLSLPLAMVLLFTKPLLLAFGQQPVLAQAAGLFVLPLCLGLPFGLGFQVLRNFATALGKPNTSLLVMAVSVGFNAVADYALIFGHFGFPRLGILGSGIASASSFAFSCLAMAAVVTATPALRKFHITRHFLRPDWSKFAELFRLGMPIGMTMMFEAMLFNAATLLMGTFGTAPVAAHQVAMNVSTITFMVPLGVAMAASVRVGLAAGAGDRARVRRAGYSALGVSVSFMSLCALLITIFAPGIAGLYFVDGNSSAAAIALTVTFLQVAAAFQIFDGIQVTAALILRGLKDAHMPMWIAAGSYWCAGFPVCIGLSLWLGMGGLGIWIGLAFALFVAAISMCGRFYYLSRDRVRPGHDWGVT